MADRMRSSVRGDEPVGSVMQQRHGYQPLERVAQVGGGDGARCQRNVDTPRPYAVGFPVVRPAHELGAHAADAHALAVLAHAVEHAAREIGCDDVVVHAAERNGQRPGAAPHVEHALARTHASIFQERLDVGGGGVGLLVGLRALVPVLGAVGRAPRLLERDPLLVPVGRGQLGGESVDRSHGAPVPFVVFIALRPAAPAATIVPPTILTDNHC